MRYFILILSLWAFSAQAVDGLIKMRSFYSVAKTMERLQAEVQRKGFNIIAKVDHARAGQQAGFNLKPVQLLIFGKPRVGSLLIQIDPTVAIDLPMKYLVWKDKQARVWIGWNDPKWIMRRHHMDKPKLAQKMSKVMQKMAKRAAGH